QAVRERGFAVVNVRDDAEIAYELRIHCFRLPAGAAAFERAMHAAKKPCRVNIQFATSLAARQHRRTRSRIEAGMRWFEGVCLETSWTQENAALYSATTLILAQRHDGIDV